MEWLIPIVVSVVITLSYLGISKRGWFLNKHDVKRIKAVAKANQNAGLETDDFSMEKWIVERRRMRKEQLREWELEWLELTHGFSRSKTVEVAAIQRHLRTEGLYSGPCDGHWGPEASRALRLFNKQMQPPGVDRAVRPLLDGGEYIMLADGRSEIKRPDGNVLHLGRNGSPWDDEPRYPYSRRGAPDTSYYEHYENPPIATDRRGITMRYENERWSEPFS